MFRLCTLFRVMALSGVLSTALATHASTAGAACDASFAGVLTLSQAVSQALCTNPATREATARLQAAQAGAEISAASTRPQLNATVSASQVEASRHGSGSTVQAQLRLSHVLFDGGARAANTEAARLNMLATQRDTSAQAQTVMLEAAKRFYDLQTSLSRVEAAQEAVRSAQVSVDAANTRLSLGYAVRAEVLQAQANLAQAQLQRVQAEGGAEVARVALYQYAGIPLDTTVRFEAQPLSCAMAFAEEVEPLLAQARSYRPELLAAQHRVRSAQQSVSAARKQNSPTLSWTAVLGAQRTSDDFRAGSASVGLVLDVPLADGGLSRARVAQASANHAQEQARYDNVFQDLELEVRQAHVRLSAAARACGASQVYLEAAQAAEAQARGRYESGVGSLLDWIALQSQKAAARERLDTALADLARARTELGRAIGQLSVDSL